MQTAQQRKPWIIVLTETKLTDARQDRVVFQEYLPEYTLFHSCVKGNASGHCITGSGGVAIAVHKSLISQNLVELIDHNNPAAKSHLKTLKTKPPGKDCLTIWGVYLPSDLQKREVLYQVITGSMSSKDTKASLAGLPLPYNIMAGDMNAALFKQDVQRAKLDVKDTNTITSSEICIYEQQTLTNTHVGNTLLVIEQTAAKTVESMTYSYQRPCAQRWHPPRKFWTHRVMQIMHQYWPEYHSLA